MAQLTSIRARTEFMKNTVPDATLVMIGDFNDSGMKLLPIKDSAAMNDYAAPQVTSKACDHLFTSEGRDAQCLGLLATSIQSLARRNETCPTIEEYVMYQYWPHIGQN